MSQKGALAASFGPPILLTNSSTIVAIDLQDTRTPAIYEIDLIRKSSQLN